MADMVVYEDKFFAVISPEFPLNCRDDGGHLVLLKKETVYDRSEMSAEEAINFIRISMMIGKAMYEVLGVERMNYEDLGNWGVDKPLGSHMHLHFFGRGKEQTHQIRGSHMMIYPEKHIIYMGHLQPFTEKEVNELKSEVEVISKQEKYVKMAKLAGL